VTRPALPLLLTSVSKSIARREILRDITLECHPGTVTALLGPNGAGKTTTVSIATGLRRPSAGAVRVFGADAASRAARSLFSLVPQDVGLPTTVRVHECLEFVARQRPPSSFAESPAQICSQLGVDRLLRRAAGGLSGGERRRVCLALGLVRVPGLLILDEAATNLDEEARAQAWSAVRDYATRGGAVLATSHILADIEANADRVVAVAAGQVVQSGTVADIRGLLGGSLVSVRLAPTEISEIVSQIDRCGLGKLEPDPTADRTTWRTDDPVPLVARLAELSTEVTELTVVPIPLGDLLTRRAPNPSQTS
jgi:ABC-2 type transport system ATP-binding protein